LLACLLLEAKSQIFLSLLLLLEEEEEEAFPSLPLSIFYFTYLLSSLLQTLFHALKCLHTHTHIQMNF